MPYRLIWLAAAVTTALAWPAAAAEEEKHPLAGLTRPGDSLETGHLSPAVDLGEGVTFHRLSVRTAPGKYKVELTIDPNRPVYDEFGDVRGSTKLPVKRIAATLRARNVEDPGKQGRKLYDVEAEKFPSRLTIMVGKSPFAPPPGVGYSLLVRDKDGKTQAAYRLNLHEEQVPLPPCHPGCFPAGTLVVTPDGPKKIETIKPGDVVLDVPSAGKPVPIKVASVFVGNSDLVEIDTEAGKLVTTGKQPLLLANGELRGGAGLVAGDALQRWQDGKAVSTKVRSVKALPKPQRVFNLVLEKRGTFVANGYLVRSKPPAAE